MKPSEMSLEQLSRIGKSYYFDKNNIEEFEQFERQLTDFLHSGAYFYNDQIVEARHLVDRLGKIKIEIYSNEHVPPHFHVSSNGLKASFTIDDCTLLENSGFNGNLIKNIQDWFLHSKDKLIEVWNKTRPSDCVVGVIQ
ncbi:MAG: DUF4160 domain-containing protein [Sulfurimonas sp.]